MSKTRLLIARHGNTFRKGETPTRVGGRTDLELVEEGKGRAIGKYLKDKNLIPTEVFSAPLKRTTQTAQLAMKELGISGRPTPESAFTEIDYGPDENKTEDAVCLRLGRLVARYTGRTPENMTDDDLIPLGEQVISVWNRYAEAPPGWIVDPAEIIEDWKCFATTMEKEHQGENILLVTSNGIARFAPHLTADFNKFAEENELKIATGGLCIFEKEEGDVHWTCTDWNVRPDKLV